MRWWRQLDLPRMTGYRMARTLQSAGYLVTDPQSGRYRLGPALLASTYLSEGYADLVGIARPYLESLVDETGNPPRSPSTSTGWPCASTWSTRPGRTSVRSPSAA